MNDSQQPNAADLATLKTIAEQVVGTCPGLLDTAREVATTLLRNFVTAYRLGTGEAA